MQFRFECVKPSEIEDNVYNDIEFPTNLSVVYEFEMDDTTRWDNVLLQFAKFLDATGYIGVYDKVSKRVDEDWATITEGLGYEDINSAGLSD
jgi:hypothetical protein